VTTTYLLGLVTMCLIHNNFIFFFFLYFFTLTNVKGLLIGTTPIADNYSPALSSRSKDESRVKSERELDSSD
jgi:hypothetical protein